MHVQYVPSTRPPLGRAALALCLSLGGMAVAADAGGVEGEAREILDQLLRVDTSHGGETAALRPVLARLEQAGVRGEIIESSPGRGNLVARIRGSGARRPLLLLAHVDVVPVEHQPWTTPPFTPTTRDGYLYARGVGDDKSMAAAIVAVALDVARHDLRLSRDLIVALTAGEETGGTAGVRWLVEHRPELLDAEIALNEGGSLRLSRDAQRIESVWLQVSEKTFQSFRLVARGPGGHSSTPPTTVDPVLALARALVRVGEHRFPARVLSDVRDTLALMATVEPPPLGPALRNAARSAPALAPEDELVIARDRLVNALVRTTCVTTMLSGSPQDNALPTTAEATVNCRVLPDESPEATRARLREVVGDAGVEVLPLEQAGSGPSSRIGDDVSSAARRVAGELWGDVPVVHTMSTGASDSRFLRQRGVQAYGISCAPSTLDEVRSGHSAHGADERRLVAWLGDGVRFLRTLTLALAR